MPWVRGSKMKQIKLACFRAFVLMSFAFSVTAQAINPEPDGNYPIAITAEGVSDQGETSGPSPQALASLLTLDNGTIKVGVDTSYGGAITYLSQSGTTTNLINDYDHGRQVQQSYYSGPANFVPLGAIQNPNWSPFPWNPVQAGDSYGYSSQVLASSNANSIIYVKTRPKQWALQNWPADCIMEQWTHLDGPAVRVHCKLTNNRSDHTQYPPFGSTWYGHELPAAYGVGTLCHIFTYTGTAPFTGGTLTQKPLTWPPVGWRATENWSAFVDGSHFGVGVHNPDAINTVGGYSNAGNPCTGGSADNNTAYLAPVHLDVLDWNIVYEYDFNLIVGTLTAIRSWVYAHRSDHRPDYHFATSRQHWYANYGDAGPPSGFLRADLNGPDPSLVGPYTAFPASTCPKIYFAARYVMSSPPADPSAQLFWETNNSGDFSETRSETVTVIPDGRWRIYSFNVGANAAWSGLISQLRLDPIQSGGTGDYVDLAGISSAALAQTALGNISTRGLVQTGQNLMIGGFIVQGTGPKRVIIRAIGPELTQHGITNALANPTLELHNGSGALIARNDNWQTTILGGIITSNQVTDIQNSGHVPTAPSESAIVANLPPGNYTAIVRGVNNTTGVALVEVYDLN
jgi:hypothetical protein